MLKNAKILVVDDDKDDQLFLIETIQELYPSFHCAIADNGQEALDYLHKNLPLPAYIFLDLNMPLVNGFEFLKEFKKYNNNNETSVIIYSTSSHPKDREISRDLGAADYIIKMYDADLLKLKLTTVIEKI